MLLKQIDLNNFRNFDHRKFTFNHLLTVIIGANALGKTNLLEGIYFIINGTGFRETKEIELINFDREGSASIEGIFEDKQLDYRFKIILTAKEDSLQKSFLINGTKKRHFQYSQDQTRCVLFTPQQIEILTGSPQRRRDYFNKFISLYDYEYKKRLDDYDSGLRRRNKVLEHHDNRNKLKEEIKFWDDYLIERANYLTTKRQEYIDFLNKNHNIDSKSFTINYLKNEFTREKAERLFDREALIRKTSLGPQKDDFQVFLHEKDVHRFGSRSEQRLTILWLKINEILYYESNAKKKPILLFDDIFSELDSKNKKLVFSLVEKYQTVATTTDREILDLAKVEHEVIEL